MDKLKIEGAKFHFRNFAGKATDKSPAGIRQFGVRLDEDIALRLKEDGWNIKSKPDHRNFDAMIYYLPVACRFDPFPPAVYSIADGRITKLTEETVAELDSAEIESADMIISPHQWTNPMGNHGVKAYLQKMYVTIKTDDLDRKYGHMFARAEAPDDDDDGSLPWD